MFKIFRTYSPISVITIFIATLIAKLYWLIHPVGATILQHEKAWHFILDTIQMIIGNSPFAMTFFAVVNLAGQAIYSNRIASENNLFPTRNYLPAFCFILFSSLIPSWNQLSAALISNWFILLALSGMLQLQNNINARKNIFNIGLAISCAGILSFSGFIFLPLLFISLSICRPFKAGEWVLGLLGLLTPIYFLGAFVFLIGDLSHWSLWLPQTFHLIDHNPNYFIKFYISVIFLLLIFIVGIFYLNKYAEHTLIQVKKRWSIIITGLGLSLIPLFIEGIGDSSIFAVIALCLIATNIWLDEKNKWTGRILFYLFIAVLIFAQWIPIH